MPSLQETLCTEGTPEDLLFETCTLNFSNDTFSDGLPNGGDSTLDRNSERLPYEDSGTEFFDVTFAIASGCFGQSFHSSVSDGRSPEDATKLIDELKDMCKRQKAQKKIILVDATIGVIHFAQSFVDASNYSINPTSREEYLLR